MKPKLIVGNWKMNGSLALIETMVNALRQSLNLEQPPCQMAICPPAPYLGALAQATAGTPIGVGAQNIYPQASGAFTGEISVGMLKELQATYCIVGHSERRAYFGETDEFVQKKVRILLESGVRPILCIGEVLEQREQGIHEQVVIDQLKKGLQEIPADLMAQVIIAYEPVWAIGTGKTATSEQANQMHEVIRQQLRVLLPSAANSIPILYGGSANGGNAAALLQQPEIDGLLVGGASLKPDEFCKMLLAAA